MNVNALVSAVRYRSGWGDDVQHDTPILYALNTIQRNVQQMINFYETINSGTITLVAGTMAYALASDFLKMIKIWNSNTYDHELQPISPNEFKVYLSDVDTTRGTPYHYYIHSSTTNIPYVDILPVASAAATVPYFYTAKMAELVEGGSANVLTTRYPDLYIEGAAWIMYRDEIYKDQPEKIAFRKQMFNDQIEIAKLAQRNVDDLRKITPQRVTGHERKLYTTQTTGYSS